MVIGKESAMINNTFGFALLTLGQPMHNYNPLADDEMERRCSARNVMNNNNLKAANTGLTYDHSQYNDVYISQCAGGSKQDAFVPTSEVVLERIERILQGLKPADENDAAKTNRINILIDGPESRENSIALKTETETETLNNAGTGNIEDTVVDELDTIVSISKNAKGGSSCDTSFIIRLGEDSRL